MGRPSQIRQDFQDALAVATSILPAVHTTAQNGAAVDCDNHKRTAVVFHFGAVTDGTITPGVEESDDGLTNWTAATVFGTVDTATSSTDEKVVVLGVKRTKRFIRAITTETVASSGYAASACVVGDAGKIT